VQDGQRLQLSQRETVQGMVLQRKLTVAAFHTGTAALKQVRADLALRLQVGLHFRRECSPKIVLRAGTHQNLLREVSESLSLGSLGGFFRRSRQVQPGINSCRIHCRVGSGKSQQENQTSSIFQKKEMVAIISFRTRRVLPSCLLERAERFAAIAICSNVSKCAEKRRRGH
jgi:hypothetical protein